MSRDELVAKARALGVERPELMTRVELGDEIVRRSQLDPATQRGARGWLGVARDMVASVVESGLNLPDAAALIRGDRGDLDARGPAPVATVTLAEIYATQGHVERAFTMLEEVLAKEPDHPAALALQTRLITTPRRSSGNRAAPSQTISAESPPSALDEAAVLSEPAPLTTLSEPTFEPEPEEEEVDAAGPPSEGPSESQVEVEVRLDDAPPPLSEPPPLASESDMAARFDETESSTAIRVRESGGEEAAFTAEPSPTPLQSSSTEAAPASFAPPPRTDTLPVPSDSSPFNEFVAAHPGTLPIMAPEPVVIDAWRGSAAEFPPEQMALEPNFEALAAPITETMETLAVSPIEEPESVASSAESADAVTAPRIVLSELLEAAKAPAESIVLVLRTRGVHPSVCWAIPESLLRDSGGSLELECVGFVPAKDGAERRELSLSVDAPRGRLTLPLFDTKTVLRVALGSRDGEVFVPRVIASEFSVENDIIGVRYRPPFSRVSAPSASEVAAVTEFLR